MRPLTTTVLAITVLAMMVCVGAPACGDEVVTREMKRDTVLRAIVDELDRSKSNLVLDDLERPYFIEYLLADATGVRIEAELGSISTRDDVRTRSLAVTMRVGSYELDNTNFSGGRGGGGIRVPIEDDYNAIRQAAWWATDRSYKRVAEALVRKKAFMESKMITDKPDDFSRETPTVYFEPRTQAALQIERLEELAVTLSRVFLDYPDIQSSSVFVQGVGGNRYLVNTEGTRMRIARMRFSVSANAVVQADDGMRLSDVCSFNVRRLDDLPSIEDLSTACHEMARRLIQVKSAPMLESYTGPVLIDAQAAASIFARRFAHRFGGGQRAVGSRTAPDNFANKLNKRILPRFMNIVDDPTQPTVAGIPAMGHYRYDDQGVPAQPVKLVEKGRLTALLMSRNPSKEFGRSNGHGRGGGRGRGLVGSLVVSSDEALSEDGLRQELADACKEEDLEYGIRIASMGRGGTLIPLVLYKTFPDGREELARGAEIAQLDMKAFKRILAAGDTPHALNAARGQTIAVPALLFEELDLAKIDRDFDKPPILETPMKRSSQLSAFSCQLSAETVRLIADD